MDERLQNSGQICAHAHENERVVSVLFFTRSQINCRSELSAIFACEAVSSICELLLRTVRY